MTVTVDDIVQLRVGGLPVEAARSLTSPEALEWAENVRQARGRVFALRAEVSDRLAEYVRAAPDGLRKELVQIRRAVFNGRRTDRAVAALPVELSTPVAAIIEPVKQAESALEALRAEGESCFSQWLIDERRQLASLLEDEDFADGLRIAVPAARRSMHAYPSQGVVAAPNKEMRKCERSLMSYAMRASAKASPFSTFTPTALATFTQGRRGWEHLPSRPRRHSRWSIYPVARTLGWLREDRRWLHGLPLRLSRTVSERPDGALDVVRSVYDYKDNHRAEDYASCEQSVVRIRHSEVCRILRDVLSEGTLVFERVVEALADRAGLAPQRAGEAVARLVRLGFVEVDGLDLHPHSAHGAGTARRVLRDVGDADAVGLAEALDLYERAASAVGGTTGVERSEAISQVRSTVEGLYRAAGLDIALPRTVVYEDCVLGSEIYRGPQLRWTEQECRALTRFTTVMDASQADRALMQGYFVQSIGHGGRCTDVPGFLRAFNDDLYDSHKSRTPDPSGAASEDPWLRWGDAWRWTRARQTLTELIEQCEEELDLLPLLEEDSQILDGLELARHRYQHIFLFAQLLPEGAAGSMVINHIFGHAGFGLSRFAYMHDDGGGVARDQQARARQAGVQLAELTGGTAFTNLNLHLPLLDTEIVQLGDPGGSRSRTRLRLEELVLEHRPEDNRLVLLSPDGQEVQPAYLGYLVLSATPVMTQLLSLLAPASNVASSIVPSLPEGQSLRVLPRVRLGSLILRRCTTQVSTSLLPSSSPATPAGYLEWVSWWKELGLPERCYVSLEKNDGVRRGKPRYLDISGLVNLAAALHEWRGQEGWINIVEAMPDLSETVINRDGDHRIHEMVLGFDLSADIPEGAAS